MIVDGDFSSSSEDYNSDILHEDSDECKEDSSECKEDVIDGDQCTSSSFEKENLELKSELEDLRNKFLRVSAEYDNYRKRTLKEKSESYNSGISEVIISILPVLDNLERAKSVDGDVDSLKKGIDMVVSLFCDVLGKLGVEEIDTTGKFDPNLHEAVSHVSDESFEENVIIEVLQKGYKTGSKIIRHSMVKVAN